MNSLAKLSEILIRCSAALSEFSEQNCFTLLLNKSIAVTTFSGSSVGDDNNDDGNDNDDDDDKDEALRVELKVEGSKVV